MDPGRESSVKLQGDLQTCGPATLPAHWQMNMMPPTTRCLVVPAALELAQA